MGFRTMQEETASMAMRSTSQGLRSIVTSSGALLQEPDIKP
jgi:hypothetical protein